MDSNLLRSSEPGSPDQKNQQHHNPTDGKKMHLDLDVAKIHV